MLLVHVGSKRNEGISKFWAEYTAFINLMKFVENYSFYDFLTINKQ